MQAAAKWPRHCCANAPVTGSKPTAPALRQNGHPLTFKFDRIGVRTNALHSKNVDEYLGKLHFGYVITVCDWAEQNCPTAFLTMGQRLHWSIEDPLKFQGTEEETLATFRRICDETDQLIHAWLTSNLNEATCHCAANCSPSPVFSSSSA